MPGRNDKALADELDVFVTTYGPLNHSFRTKQLPKLWLRVRQLNKEGLHAQADALALRIEQLDERSKALDRKIDAAMEKMLRIRNRTTDTDRDS